MEEGEWSRCEALGRASPQQVLAGLRLSQGAEELRSDMLSGFASSHDHWRKRRRPEHDRSGVLNIRERKQDRLIASRDWICPPLECPERESPESSPDCRVDTVCVRHSIEARASVLT